MSKKDPSEESLLLQQAEREASGKKWRKRRELSIHSGKKQRGSRSRGEGHGRKMKLCNWLPCVKAYAERRAKEKTHRKQRPTTKRRRSIESGKTHVCSWSKWRSLLMR